MDFVTAIKTCFSKYATFQGRAARPEFWWWTLFWVLLISAVAAISYSLYVVITLALFLPGLAVSVRRLHDVGRSGWFLLFPVSLGAIALIVSRTAGLHRLYSASGGTMVANNASGLLVAAGIFGVMGFVAELVLLVWFCQKGHAGPNRYGEAPLTSVSAATQRPMAVSS